MLLIFHFCRKQNPQVYVVNPRVVPSFIQQIRYNDQKRTWILFKILLCIQDMKQQISRPLTSHHVRSGLVGYGTSYFVILHVVSVYSGNVA
jgi:hypothetical protein